MAVRTKIELLALYGLSGSIFPDNTVGAISELDMRNFGQDLTDSLLISGVVGADNYTWASPLIEVTGGSTLTGTANPAIASYGHGQTFKIRSANTSTAAVTLNISGVGAKKLYIDPTTQADDGNLIQWTVYNIIYLSSLDSASGGFLIIGYERVPPLSFWNMDSNAFPSNSKKGQQYYGTITTSSSLLDSSGNPLPSKIIAMSLVDNAATNDSSQWAFLYTIA